MDRFEISGEEVLDGEVKPFGNGAHVTVPKDWRRTTVKVVRTGESWSPADGLDLPLETEAGPRDRLGGWTRLPSPRLEELDLEAGDAVELAADGTAAATVRRADRNDPENVVRATPAVRRTVGAPGEGVTVRPASPAAAREVVLRVAADEADDGDFDVDGAEDVSADGLGEFLEGRPLVAGQLVGVPSDRGFVRFGWHYIPFRVRETVPDGVVAVDETTDVTLADEPNPRS